MLGSMQSDAKTVADYLTALPVDRREAVEALRAVVLKNLPQGYEEAMNWGMITYQVPLSIEPKTYNGQPLSYAAIASQKNNLAFYFMCDGGEGKLAKAWANPRRKPDIGKSCLRFKSLADIDLDVIGQLIASTPVTELVRSSKREPKL